MGGASLSQPGLGPLGSWSPCSKSRMGAFSSRGSRWSVPGAVKLHRGKHEVLEQVASVEAGEN